MLTSSALRVPAPVDQALRDRIERKLLTQSIPREHGFEPLRVDGRLPPDLRGTLLRNGPGQFEIFGRRIGHSFEADGLVTAIRLDGARALGACRLTASTGRAAEQAAGRMLYGSALPWRQRLANVRHGRQKNTANTSIVTWQGRVLALMEAARPTELSIDGADLATVGETDLGVIGAAFSAHPHRVAARRASYNFGVEYGRRTRIALYELPDVGPARRLGAVDLGFAPMLHDFIATARHLVFFVSPAAVHVPRMLLQLGGFEDLFRWQPARGTEIIVVPIDEPTRVTRFGVDAFYQWHFANAFERGAELVVDYVRYPDFGSFKTLARGTTASAAPLGGELHRATLDLAGRRFTSEARLDRAVEFPRVHPTHEGAPHDVTWLAADGLQTVLAHRADGAHREYRFEADEVISEPVFVPRGSNDEADGWVLTLVYDHRTARSSLAILDGLRLGDGPVARAWFDHHVPMTFHGTFVSPSGPAAS